jgi:hypothetical protein
MQKTKFGLRDKLKQWENEFEKQNSRAPRKSDIDKYPEIVKMYKEYKREKKGLTNDLENEGFLRNETFSAETPKSKRDLKNISCQEIPDFTENFESPKNKDGILSTPKRYREFNRMSPSTLLNFKSPSRERNVLTTNFKEEIPSTPQQEIPLESDSFFKSPSGKKNTFVVKKKEEIFLSTPQRHQEMKRNFNSPLISTPLNLILENTPSNERTAPIDDSPVLKVRPGAALRLDFDIQVNSEKKRRALLFSPSGIDINNQPIASDPQSPSKCKDKEDIGIDFLPSPEKQEEIPPSKRRKRPINGKRFTSKRKCYIMF